MVVNEYGSPTDPAVILLAPMMVSGSDLYELMSPHFSGTYYFIAPDQGGHGKAGSYKNADVALGAGLGIWGEINLLLMDPVIHQNGIATASL